MPAAAYPVIQHRAHQCASTQYFVLEVHRSHVLCRSW